MSDLIIEGAKGIPDGLYVIKDGLLFKYKPNGGAVYTARAYRVTDRPKGKWIETAQGYYETVNKKGGGVNENTEYFTDDIACSECLTKFSNIDNETERFNFCPNCGADMRGNND